ncbi:hypothetical protein PAMC26577_35270 [Caballeronia sordidicola]|uniref:Uncharacterized protein n=1 Tax=Caballeronia sordidicola TaxID=196367 RepID=A0A2C9XX29_CABSO|nr:hypothetical protein PAMC26577_35270 [Caballeronia sordidicola]
MKPNPIRMLNRVRETSERLDNRRWPNPMWPLTVKAICPIAKVGLAHHPRQICCPNRTIAIEFSIANEPDIKIREVKKSRLQRDGP